MPTSMVVVARTVARRPAGGRRAVVHFSVGTIRLCASGPERWMEAPYRQEAGDDEQDQPKTLRHGEWRFRAGGRKIVQVGELAERLHDADEDVEPERDDGTDHVDRTP